MTVLSALSISTRLAVRVVEAASARGVDGDALCLAVGLDPVQLRDIDSRVDFDGYIRLWGAAMAAVRDPAFTLAVAENGGETHNLLRFICMTSENLGEALRCASRYLRILTNAASWPVDYGEEVTVVGIVRHGEPLPSCRFADEFAIAELVTLARLFTGVDWDPREVRFTHPEPRNAAPLRIFFRAPVRFGCSRAELHIRTNSLELPLVKADPGMRMFFESYADKLLGAGPGADTLTERVRQVLGASLRGEPPTVDDVAASLAMSGRTLRRHLQAEGATFQKLLDDTRFSLAKQHLRTGTLSSAEISFLLGFSEPSAFHRAFRRWSGTTPLAYARSGEPRGSGGSVT